MMIVFLVGGQKPLFMGDLAVSFKEGIHPTKVQQCNHWIFVIWSRSRWCFGVVNLELSLILGIQSYSQLMIGVSNHLQNAQYLGSNTILRRWARIPRVIHFLYIVHSQQYTILAISGSKKRSSKKSFCNFGIDASTGSTYGCFRR